MTSEPSELDLIAIFNSLSEVPLTSASKEEALGKIAELAHRALKSRACSLVSVDLREGTVTQEACAGLGAEFAARMNGRTRRMGPPGSGCSVDYELLARGEGGAVYGLGKAGNGVARPEVARRYGLNSVLSSPLKQGGVLTGYFNHFSATTEPFTEHERRLSEIFGRQAVVVLERFEYHHTLVRLSRILGSLSRNLLTVSEDEYLGGVPEGARSLLNAPVCIVWKFDEARRVLKIVATAGEVDARYREIELDPERQAHIKTNKIGYLPDVAEAGSNYYRHGAAAAARGWVSLLTAPMWVGERLIGMLDVYTDRPRRFKEWEKKFFETFADYAALSIQKAELLREAAENLMGRQRLEALNEVIQEVSTVSNLDDLMDVILNRSLALVGADKGWVAKFDLRTGQLNVEAYRGEPFKAKALKYGQGITGLALKMERPMRADDVRQGRWRGVYEQCWVETRSELAVPILVSNAQARVGRGAQAVTKPVGVINVESPTAGAFTQADEDVLWSLARHAATVIEKLESDRKLPELQSVERAINEVHGWDETIRVMVRAITETLGFEYVNVSLVELEANRIRTEYVVGIPDRDAEEFKRLAQHPLDSNDIQASVVRTGAVEVPDVTDERFDKQIYRRFRHGRLIRVFVPMVASSGGHVMGTVEAGYRRGYRKHIYEQDVRTLQRFVDYVARAFERKRRALLPRIMHEFEAPTVGIRNNVSFLKSHRNMGEGLVQLKYDDILTDCELLLLKIGELEYIFGGNSPVSRRDLTLVYRDIIIKTVNQLRPLVAERGFDMARVKYHVDDIRKVKIYVDKAKLNSVVYNLLINAIKYAENDPARFGLGIAAKVARENFVITVKDWGIGINRAYAEKIFEEGFRAPEAAVRFVTGSGLGLTIARKAMRELGGDLLLANCSKPTEFRLLLPKSLREVPGDSVRG